MPTRRAPSSRPRRAHHLDRVVGRRPRPRSPPRRGAPRPPRRGSSALVIANVDTRPSIVGGPCSVQASGRPSRKRCPSAASCSRMNFQPTLCTYSTAATKPRAARAASVPVSKPWPSGIVRRRPHLVRPPLPEQLAARRPRRRGAARRTCTASRAARRRRLRQVDRAVRRVVDGVAPGERAGLVGDRGDLVDRRHRADGVRGPRERDDARALGEQRAQVVEVEPALGVEVAEARPRSPCRARARATARRCRRGRAS